ncbi:MAG TPA: hypothetical protein DCZ92_14820 [Elusimicrobia bacterium]|nr:MAG: hypothetical protein A2016_10840 [Elusimicrobia bacterium GWF2_62_30]HBA62055.1 hypothetical protein [Elusimicrobiota bacterium]
MPRPVAYVPPPERVRLTLYYSAAAHRAWIRTVHINGAPAPAQQADYAADNASPGDSFRRFRH